MRALVLIAGLLAGCSDYKLNSGGPANQVGPDGGAAAGDGGAGDGGGDSGSQPPDDEQGDGGGGSSTDGGGDGGTDGGAVSDGRKIDVVILVDTAYWYDCYHPDLAAEVDGLVDALLDSGHDAAVAIATYDDYNVAGQWWAADGGLPYVLLQQLTTDRVRLHAASATLAMVWGGDGPGSGYEAVVQAMRGRGYDQNCNGSYDHDTDVRPFSASSSDAFGGSVTGLEDSGTPGTGTSAGVGFRTGAERVVVLNVQDSIRDTSYGHDIPSGACPGVASESGAASALTGIGAHMVGVNAYEFSDIDSTPQDQLRTLASDTSSLWDADGDGRKNDLAVLSSGWEWPATSDLTRAIFQVSGIE